MQAQVSLTQIHPAAIVPTITFRGKRYYTCPDLLKKRGLKDPKVPTVAQARAAARRQAGSPRTFPSDREFQHQILIERQSPLFHFEAPDCIGDGPQFSSRSLTDWYVRRYCQLNHLKEC